MVGVNDNAGVSDEEIIADLFRLARTGRFSLAEPLLREAERMHPAEPPIRILSCLKQLGLILWENDHGGYATEYKLNRRPAESSLSARA